MTVMENEKKNGEIIISLKIVVVGSCRDLNYN